VYKVAAAYAVVGWLLIQVATQVFPFLEIPNWAIRLVILITALGFPVALIIAWAFELTPEGIKRTEAADAARQRSRGGVWIAVVVIAATLLLGLFFLGRYTAGRPTPRQSESAMAIPDKSIAVLPLVNTSGDPSNEYFSDGLSEELIAVLAKIPELKVIGRSSSFFFKEKSSDSTAIGQKLGVANLIEGSVRKQGDRVRIVAELISAADGRSLWTETYDRDLKDVFAVQSEIAKAVAEQMKVKLLGETVRSDAPGSSENPAAHNAVLQSDFYFQQQTAESVRQAITFLQEAVRLDPNYALAYAKLAQAWRQYGASYATDAPDDIAKAYGQARLAADKAINLAPDLAQAQMAVGMLAMNPDLNFRAAEKEFRRVLQSSPSDAAAKSALCNALLAQGRLIEAEQTCREALSLDPLLTSSWYNSGRVAVGLGRYKEGEELFRKGLEIQPHASRFHSYLVILDIVQNRPAQALANAQLESEGFWRDYAVNLAQQAQNDPSTTDLALKDFIVKYPNTGPFQIAVLYALRKEPDEMFKWLDTAYATRDSGLTQLAVTPFFFPYLHDPRFTALCQKLNVQLPATSANP
jgi:TolB-like protein/Tfp pilus assembly protein PilF